MQPGQIIPVDLGSTNLVSLPPAGQTAQIETLSAADFGFRVLPFSEKTDALLYFQVGFDRSHPFLPRPDITYGARWSLRTVDGSVTIVDRRPISRTERGVLCEKVDIRLDGTKGHILTIHVKGASYVRVLKLFKAYFNPSMRVTFARGGNLSRGAFETIG